MYIYISSAYERKHATLSKSGLLYLTGQSTFLGMAYFHSFLWLNHGTVLLYVQGSE